MFTHDTDVALQSAAALVNTGRAGAREGGEEQLATVADLEDFVREWAFTGSRTHDATELAAVRELRPRLRRIWELAGDPAAAAEHVNAILREHAALPQLVEHDDQGWHIHAVGPQESLATRMAVEAAMALVDVVRAGELSRLRVCAAPDCEDVLVDLSRNRSRRFCDISCSNRVAAAAYRARRA